ncbi:MAG: hypothetical protein HFE63_01280 [Clostridiales bacterium]|nr:hypothetical protein [Clostridiales bacterium]
MPTALMLSDNSLPKFTEGQSDTERLKAIYSYLFMLVEQLRYSLSNLGADNFNDTELEEIESNISDPLKSDIKSIVQVIAGEDGNLSELTQTSVSLISRISNNEGNISTLAQTVNGLTLSVSNGSTSSTIRLMSGAIELSSQNISFSGVVTFYDLQNEGSTVINGSNITTGTIKAINIEGCNITGSLFNSVLESDGTVSGALSFYYLNKNYLAGGIMLDDTGAGNSYETKYRMFLYTKYVNGIGFGLKLMSAGGMSLESERSIYCYAPEYIVLRSDGYVEVNDPVLIDSDGGSWTFNSEGIFRDGSLIASASQSEEMEL